MNQPAHPDQVTPNPQLTTNTEQFAITGMTCQSCASRIEKVLNKKPAIESATVNFATETLTVTYDADSTDADEVMAWVEKQAFTPHR